MPSGTRQLPSQPDDHVRTSLEQWRPWLPVRLGPILLGLSMAMSWGCNAMLPTAAFFNGGLNRSANPSESSGEFVLVDRTGQSLAGESAAQGPTAENALPSSAEAPIPPSVVAQRTALSLESPTTSVSTTQPSTPESTRAALRTAPSPPTTTTTSTTTTIPPTPTPAPQSDEIHLVGPTPGLIAPTESGTSSWPATNSPQGQSLRVQVTNDSPGADEPTGMTPAEYAASQSMAQAIQQVTQRGLGRLASGQTDSAASPALANLLMDQVQQSVSNNQLQQASLALQNLETAAEFPAFDLRSNRPLNEPTSNPTNQAVAPASVTLDAPPAVAATTDPAADSLNWRTAIQQAVDSIERSIAQSSQPQERESLEIYLRLLKLIAHDPDQAVRSIDSLPKHRQNFWREQIFALSQIIQAPEADQEVMFVNHSRQATKALAHLQNAIDSLKAEATLQLRQVQFCQEIRSFGDYDLARTTLVAPGEPMLVYCEVFNYSAQRLNDAGGDHFHTSLLPSYLIMDSNQQVVSQKEFSVVRDRCRSRRQDFYLVLQVEAPNLPAGKYHLQISVEDLEAGKIAVAAPLTFQIRK